MKKSQVPTIHGSHHRDSSTLKTVNKLKPSGRTDIKQNIYIWALKRLFSSNIDGKILGGFFFQLFTFKIDRLIETAVAFATAVPC